MEALKIVCNHHDEELIKENKLLKGKIKKVELVFKKMNDALYDILWVSRRPDTKEKFDTEYKQYKHIEKQQAEELWKKCVDTKKTYKTIFDKIDVDLDDEESDFIKYVEDYNKLMGVIGGVRSITEMYHEIMNPYEGEEDGEWLGCDICGDKCECPHYLNQLEEELFELNLSLDS
tara:strand:+ start:3617 stop:4141 length:525 start_codon:yes stop_codon:yes gene_type:complete